VPRDVVDPVPKSNETPGNSDKKAMPGFWTKLVDCPEQTDVEGLQKRVDIARIVIEVRFSLYGGLQKRVDIARIVIEVRFSLCAPLQKRVDIARIVIEVRVSLCLV